MTYIPETMNGPSFLASSFLIGAARILDVSGSIGEITRATTPVTTPAQSLARDWRSLGRDIRAAMRRHESQEQKQGE